MIAKVYMSVALLGGGGTKSESSDGVNSGAMYLDAMSCFKVLEVRTEAVQSLYPYCAGRLGNVR